MDRDLQGGLGGIRDCNEIQQVSKTTRREGKKGTHMVRQMLMSRSQLQPVMNAAAAGGKRMAT